MPLIKTFEQWQNLISSEFLEDIELDPAQVERFFVNNLVTRTLAHLVGQADRSGVLLKATAGGILKVAGTGTGFEHNESLADVDLSDNAWHDMTFAQIISRVDVFVESFDMLIKRRLTADMAWEGEIKVPKNSMYSFDCTTQALSCKNTAAAENPAFQIIGWY